MTVKTLKKFQSKIAALYLYLIAIMTFKKLLILIKNLLNFIRYNILGNLSEIKNYALNFIEKYFYYLNKLRLNKLREIRLNNLLYVYKLNNAITFM